LSGTIYQRPTDDRIVRITQILRDASVVTHFRRSRGDDVNAACGQLRETQLTQLSS
jgi:adenine C2-methylase RlmN of 23S rRNA A2503 and tRNA A37